ncbi:MAG: ATP-dependent helicase [Candidatus Cloacimonetes bacterium]|nr:ATP-dependent helicase [Candidatus Cloacimonadota bacterium]
MNTVVVSSDQQIDRHAYTQIIIDSTAAKKVIVAGPGTGKTTTFELILKQSGTPNNLVLTFINRLVNDLNCRLSDLAKVCTLHKFCMGIFNRQFPDWYMVSMLGAIISEDTGVKEDIFNELFHKLDERNPLFKLYLKRATYYKAISFNDSIYRILKKATITPSIIPDYDNILIDEYQDFSALEVAFIKQLESHGKILIVGDDDQAIYNGKYDLGDSLRSLYRSGEYTKFELPFCSRCPKVIVESVSDIVENAVKKGYLQNRINKSFRAFEPGKEIVNENYPKLQILNMASVNAAEVFLNMYISAILQDELDDYRNRDGIEPLILVIGTTKYLNIFRSKMQNIAEYIEPKQNNNIEIDQLCEGYRILLDDETSNIGWRLLLLSDKITPPKEHRRILNNSLNNTPLIDLLPEEYKQKHKANVDLIREFIGAQESAAAEANLEVVFGVPIKEKIVRYFRKVDGEESDSSSNSSYPIQFVTYQGSKGLAADYVFLLGVNNGDIPKDPTKIADYEICEFIVGLTRVKKECYVLPISNVYGEKKYRNVFLSWITPQRVANSRFLSKNDVVELFRQCKTEKQ